MSAPVPPDRITREETIFNAAVELSGAAKHATYLELACAGDPALRARLEKMFAADGENFLKSPSPLRHWPMPSLSPPPHLLLPNRWR